MEDSFKLPVTYKGQQVEFDTQVVTYGYCYRFQVHIDGMVVLYEPKEQNYRARVDSEPVENQLQSNLELVKLVGDKIEELFSKLGPE